MTLQVFAIRDTKAEAYLKPFFTPTKGLALRAFVEVANDPKQDISRYAGDYHLFRIAEYDDQTGVITPLEVKENLGCALDFIDTRKDTNSVSNISGVQKAVETYSKAEAGTNDDH